MDEYIALDSHKRYTLAEVESVSGGRARQERIEHERGAIRRWLRRQPRGRAVAVEAIGNWYWIVDEIEQAGMTPRRVHPRKAKLMMGLINKTDRLDVHGLNRLQRNGTLPTAWIPPAELRDCRIVMRRQCAELKNRVLALLEKHALTPRGISDLFGRRGHDRAVGALARHLAQATGHILRKDPAYLDRTPRKRGRVREA